MNVSFGLAPIKIRTNGDLDGQISHIQTFNHSPRPLHLSPSPPRQPRQPTPTPTPTPTQPIPQCLPWRHSTSTDTLRSTLPGPSPRPQNNIQLRNLCGSSVLPVGFRPLWLFGGMKAELAGWLCEVD
ncbi:hypothetical protein BHYA_0084g00430 [Botrytis hyacinthi]|uniref:Uncharacterized protein n=1 Tax=Botrytis hyacinthi TaxID=278943 RepID=A0A4Z1GT49_9HELO|nr:hypothetical protein BHYA_0084g00430 [Botrytis hyacinthi]